MQHRRQVRVVVVKRVDEGAVYEGGARGRVAAAPSYNARLLFTIPAVDHTPHEPGRLHLARRQGYADDVRDPQSAMLEDLRSYITIPHPGSEPGYFLQQSSGRHHCTSASGRTGSRRWTGRTASA